MVVLGLFFNADVDGLEKIKFDYDMRFNLKVLFPGGGTNDEVWVQRSEEVDLPTGRGTCNLCIKEKGSKKVATITMLEEKDNEHGVFNVSEGKAVCVARFDCRGLEIVGWNIGNGEGVTGETEKGAEFTVELEDGEYYDFDEASDTNIEMKNIEVAVQVVKTK